MAYKRRIHKIRQSKWNTIKKASQIHLNADNKAISDETRNACISAAMHEIFSKGLKRRNDADKALQKMLPAHKNYAAQAKEGWCQSR